MTKSHILVQNKTELPLWGIRLLGLSNKDENQIGRFGTGLKESIALMCRMGIYPIMFSGTCRIDFDNRKMGEQEEICFRLSEPKGDFEANKWHGLGIHKNFGHHDWKDPWMIFREIICNAYDVGGTDELYHDIVSDEPTGIENTTRIYIPATHDMVKAYTLAYDRLLFLSNDKKIAASTSDCIIFEKDEPTPVNIYHKQVWIQEGKKESQVYSLFDYCIHRLKLTESRTASWYEVDLAIFYSLRNLPYEYARDMLKTMVSDSYDRVYENILITLQYFTRLKNPMVFQPWVSAFEDEFGNDAVLCPNNQMLYNKLTRKGFRPIILRDHKLSIWLANMGIPHCDSILSQEDRTFDNVSTAPTNFVTEIWSFLANICSSLVIGKNMPEIKTFSNPPGSCGTQAKYSNGIGYIDAGIFNSELGTEYALGICIAHCTGNNFDEDKEDKFTKMLLGLLNDARKTAFGGSE